MGGTVDDVLQTEFSESFVEGMRSRMLVSYHKYGAIQEAYPAKVNALKSLQQRLEMYASTGNTEYLMDAANFAMIEFMLPAHPGAFFQGTDSDGSPGRIDADGDRTRKRNADITLNVDRHPVFPS